VFILIGVRPHTEWLAPVLSLDESGFIRTGRDVPPTDWPLGREPYPFETSRPGVFAAGDVRQGAIQRVVGAVGEGSGAVGSVHRYLDDLAAFTEQASDRVGDVIDAGRRQTATLKRGIGTVWGSGIRVPSAPPHRPGRPPAGRTA
jgi:hypothetical protein